MKNLPSANKGFDHPTISSFRSHLIMLVRKACLIGFIPRGGTLKWMIRDRAIYGAYILYRSLFFSVEEEATRVPKISPDGVFPFAFPFSPFSLGDDPPVSTCKKNLFAKTYRKETTEHYNDAICLVDISRLPVIWGQCLWILSMWLRQQIFLSSSFK